MSGIKYPVENPHNISIPQLGDELKSDLVSGLTIEDASDRNNQFGLNLYQSQKSKSAFRIFVEQFINPIVYLLVAGSAISFYFQDFSDGIAIIGVILINAIVGFLMEFQARNSMKALKKMEVTLSKVIRSGKLQEIPSEYIAPGDIVYIEAGDMVPADGRIVECYALQCDESALTGESMPAEKCNDIISKDILLAERANMVYKGTPVIKGNARVIITGIGMHTELGNITSMVEMAEESATPLDKKLNALTKKLIWLTLIITAFFIVVGLIQKKEIHLIIETAIALAVAAIPEGLPIVATIALAYGMLLMAKKNAVVKKLTSVETLGGTNIILTDKTGTLTENKIEVNTFSFPEGKVEVTIDHINKKINTISGNLSLFKESLDKILLISFLCNNASIEESGNEVKEIGDPLEVALLKLTAAAGVPIEKKPRIAEDPFSSETKIMGTLHKNGEEHLVAAKGSVEHILDKCDRIFFGGKIILLDEAAKSKIIRESDSMSSNGLRVLAFAFKLEKNVNQNEFVNGLVFVGMMGFLDPPRMDVKHAIEVCRQAGIKVIMLTGDHPKTALNIAQKLGLADENSQTVISGSEFPDVDVIEDEKIKAKILNSSVFARVTPKQKLAIADLYQKQKSIVAMTGDGVNDAPALKKADVGIAMGLRGTQVAKETADIVLKDDSFVSITEAVARGRVIFRNIQKFVIYLLSCNMSEIFVVTILGIIMPMATLLPLQILFLNIITDVFPALALGMGKEKEMIMKKSPRKPDAPIIDSRDWKTIFIYALIMSAAVAGGVMFTKYFISPDFQACNNVAFFSLSLSQLWHVFNMSSGKHFSWKNEITKNKYVWIALLICFGIITLLNMFDPLRKLLHLEPLTFEIWAVSTVTSLITLVVIQTVKILRKLKG